MDLETFEDSRAGPRVTGRLAPARQAQLPDRRAGDRRRGLRLPVNYAALARKRRIPLAKHAKFDQGVASGFPATRRASSSGRRLGEHQAHLQAERSMVATDQQVRRTWSRRSWSPPRKDRDFTVHSAGSTGLSRRAASTTTASITWGGLLVARRAPEDRAARPTRREPVRLALLLLPELRGQLQDRPRRAGEGGDVDLVGFLGDYMYERGTRRAAPDTTAQEARRGRPTAAEYREVRPRSDPNLQAMHAALRRVRRPGTTTRSRTTTPARGRTRLSADPERVYENDDESPRRVPFAPAPGRPATAPKKTTNT